MIFLFPGMDPRAMKQAMKRFGIKEEPIDAVEVVIRTRDKELVISNPQVSRVNMMGQESIQVVGDIHERPISLFSDEDISTVAEQTNCTLEEAREALEAEQGDIAAAILRLQQ